MTAHEALWLIKTQLQKNDQNLEAVKVLEDIVRSVNRVHIDDYGTEAEHMRNHMEKVARQDIQELQKLEQNMCARYEWTEDDELAVFYHLCETEE